MPDKKHGHGAMTRAGLATWSYMDESMAKRVPMDVWESAMKSDMVRVRIV